MMDRLFKLLGLLVLFGSLTLGWLMMAYQQFLERPLVLSGGQENILDIRPGSSLNAVAHQLAQRGFIEDARYFIWMARLRGLAAKIQAGEYVLESGITPPQLLQAMAEGRVRRYSITLLEGWSFRQMMTFIGDNPYLRHELKGLDEKAVMQAIGKPEESAEGRFLPETYQFTRGMSDTDLLQRAYKALHKHLEKAWAERAEGLPFKSPYEALILASIVEKETGKASERNEIAGVFVRRLQKGMRLQTDPTVIYGMGEAYDGNIRKKDLLTDTPYNTYTRRGLPPTPIAMPGADAIHAAVHPLEGKSLYFVSKGDGSHYFSATLEEHNQAVIKYQLKGKKRSFSSYKAN